MLGTASPAPENDRRFLAVRRTPEDHPDGEAIRYNKPLLDSSLIDTPHNMASRTSTGRPGGSRFAQFKLVLLGESAVGKVRSVEARRTASQTLTSRFQSSLVLRFVKVSTAVIPSCSGQYVRGDADARRTNLTITGSQPSVPPSLLKPLLLMTTQR